MASKTTLNIKNLTALGAERLAELLMELATGNAAAKRQLRLELMSHHDKGNVAAEIRKRLATIARSKSYIDWNKAKAFVKDLNIQHSAIMTHVAPANPAEAFDLLWRLLQMAPSLYERCDDGYGDIADIMHAALKDLGTVAAQAKLEPGKLSDQIFTGVCANNYGQFDGLIGLMAEPLGRKGLALLKARFEDLAKKPDQKKRSKIRLIRSALTDIADALGEVDSYVACFSDEERTNPAIAAKIAERLLTAGRAEEAMDALKLAETDAKSGGYWPDWARVMINTLEAQGRTDEAQERRWAMFEADLSAEYLKDFIKRLPDFDDDEAQERAFAYVSQYSNFHKALAFLINWPAHRQAADLVLARSGEVDGNYYELLTPAADILGPSYPLAATLLLRSMIDYSLDKARSSRYAHASRHLQSCAYLAKQIESFGNHLDHDNYMAQLKLNHGRKSAFWSIA